MELLESFASWPGAAWLRRSGTAYLFVNASHVLGIGLLIGAILPLDLRVMGFFRSVPLSVLGPFLSRAAALGLALSLLTGLWLFSVRPADYLENSAFLTKMGLIALAFANLALLHGSGAWQRLLAGAPATTTLPPTIRVAGGVSFFLWISILLAGRWIGFL